jgi:multiple sugar transport system substrate-binding protein
MRRIQVNKISRRKFIQSSVLAAAGIGAVACAPQTVVVVQAPTATSAPAAQPTQAPAKEPAKVVATEPVKVVWFVGFGTGTDPGQIEVHDKIVQEFNDSHDDIELELLTVPHEEHLAKFSTMLAADTAPDLVMPIGIGGVAEVYDEWMDIQPFIDADTYDMSDFYGPTIELHKYPGRVIGLPVGVFPTAIFYNEDIFDAAGLDYPTHKFGDSAWTYDKLVELAAELTLDENGNNANSPDFDWESTVQWGWDGLSWNGLNEYPRKFGGSPLGMSEDMKTAQMNAPAWVEAAQWMADNVWKRHIRATGEQSGAFYDVAGDPFGSGMVAMWECHSWMAYAFQDWTDSLNWDMAAVPAGPNGDISAEIDADTFAIPKSSKHSKEAWEVAKWLAQPDIMLRLTANWGGIPARKSLADTWRAEMETKYPHPDFQVFFDSIEYLDAPNHEAWTAAGTQGADAIGTAADLILTGENTNVQEVLDNLNKEVQGYLDEYWASKE